MAGNKAAKAGAKNELKFLIVNLTEESEKQIVKGEQTTLPVVMVVTDLAGVEKALEIPDKPVGDRVAVLEIKKRYSLSPIMRVDEIQ